jgi:hypothetical protein
VAQLAELHVEKAVVSMLTAHNTTAVCTVPASAGTVHLTVTRFCHVIGLAGSQWYGDANVQKDMWDSAGPGADR